MQRGNCSSAALDYVPQIMRGQSQQLMRVNGLMVANAILAGILVGVGAYGPRYRHRAFIRFLFQGATVLFLPIVSYVVSNGVTTDSTYGRRQSYNFLGSHRTETLWYSCTARWHLYQVLLWAGLVQIVGINTCAIVAADDREGRNTGLPVVLLVQAIWTSYLVVYNSVLEEIFFASLRFSVRVSRVFALIFARMAFKYYAFQKAQHSFALGRNPRLIVGYMEQLQEEIQHVEPTAERLPPPLIVMGEDKQQVEKHPRGYSFKRMLNQDDMTVMNNNNGLVTVDKVWQSDDMILASIPRLRDVCFSFALFKLLRCRFAGYTVAEAGFMKAHNFFWHVVLKDDDHGRVLGVIIDELSFLYDYYYSSLPISYSKRWLPILSIIFSLMTISYSLFLGMVFGRHIILLILGKDKIYEGQIICWFWCGASSELDLEDNFDSFGNKLFELVPVCLLLTIVVLVEVKDIASYICSNWTKVALVSHYVLNHDTWQRSPGMQRWVGRVLRCRCKLMKHWDDKMNQCSVLVPNLRKPPIALRTRLLCLPDQKSNVKVPAVVKAAIIDALRSNDGLLSNGAAFLRRNLLVGDDFLWACNGEGTADTILMWHVATSILEVRNPHSPSSDYKITATHLSRYCAYLVAYVPELLPDDDPWCKSLYKAVKKDSMRVLAGGAEAEEYEKLLKLLSERSEHDLLKKAVRLAKQLAELTEGEEAVWRVLAGFWSEMILYVAPSDNLNGHAEAIARGGELITLIWALLMHAGITTRPSSVGNDLV